MEPTLRSGDRLLVLSRRRPAVGDIVALEDPRRLPPRPDRPVGEPEVGQGPDGKRLDEKRLIVKRVVSVDGDEVVVWGDNRASSSDSRVFGPVDRRDILGRAVYRYFPPDRAGRLG